MKADPLRAWRFLGVASTAFIVLSVPAWLVRQREAGLSGDAVEQPAKFVGRDSCRPCHEQAYEAWHDSDHDKAMAEANDQTVLGDFDDATFTAKGITSRFFRKSERFMVHTQGPDGKMADFEVVYTFGVEPLQQYLVRFPGGRFQCLTIAWDGDQGRWFDLYPDQEIPPGDWLHWTRAGQNWNGMCAECHSTNLKKGFDPKANSYDTTWSEIDVSCEACHGPGSKHVAWAEQEPMARPPIDDYGLVVDTGKLSSTEQVELCAPCHSRRSELGDYDHTRVPLLDNQLPALLREGLYEPDGQILEEVYVWGSFVQSKMYANDVRCSDCHDVHSLKLRADGNELCTSCHRADAYDTKAHHFHEATSDSASSEGPSSEGDGTRCIRCHMPERPYMVIDERADHSLRIPRPDLTAANGARNACGQSGCHEHEEPSWVLEAFTRWYGEAQKPHYGTTLAAARQVDPAALPGLVRLAGDPLYPAIVRSTALLSLSRYPRTVESAAVFEQALAAEDALVRHTAVTSVSARSPEELVELVAPLLFDPVRAVRMQAAVRVADAPEETLEPYQQAARTTTLAEYEQAMTYSLDFAFAGHNLGNIYARLKQPQKAEAFFRSAIAIDDQFLPAKSNLAVLLSASGRNDEAEKILRSVVESHPEHYEVVYQLGLLLAEMHKYVEAEKHLAKAVEGMPHHPRARRNLDAVRQHLAGAGR